VKSLIFAKCAALACLLAAAPAPAAPPPDCSKCSALPMLYRELLEQEFLRKLFDKWISQSYYPATMTTMQDSAKGQLDAAINGGLYGELAPGKVGSGAGGAAPAYGTDLTSKACQLVEYYKDKEGNEQQRPVTPEKVRAKHCNAVADYVLVHERYHMDTCKASWARHGSDKFITVEYVAEDDRAAYQAGIAELRKYIAKLASDCRWSGSTNAKRPDGTMTVPTPAQILELKNNSKGKAAQLKRSSK